MLLRSGVLLLANLATFFSSTVVKAVTINPQFEGTYELVRVFHELSIRIVFVFQANGINVPVLSGQTVIPTSLGPNDDQWLDDIEEAAKNLNETCNGLVGVDIPLEDCEQGTLQVAQAVYDVNKFLVERMATGWNIDILNYGPLADVANLYPINVVFTFSEGPVAIMQSGFVFDRPSSSAGSSETTSDTMGTLMRRQGDFALLDIGLDNAQGGASNGVATLSFNYAGELFVGQIDGNNGFTAMGDYDSFVGVAVGGTDYENFGIGVSLAVTWAGETEGVQTSTVTAAPTKTPTKAPTLGPTPENFLSPAPTPDGNPDNRDGAGLCFSADATVQVLKKQEVHVVAMQDLQVGDQLWIGDDNYEPVYAFGHYHRTAPAVFYQIYTEGNQKPLEVTGDHLVFLHDKPNPVRADSIQVHDSLQTWGPSGALVTKVDTVNKAGLYAPLTSSGRVMVDKIQASSYISLDPNATEYVQLNNSVVSSILSHHTYAHIGLTPFRMLCTRVPLSTCVSYNEDGMPDYVSWVIQVDTWIHSLNSFLEILATLAALVVLGAFVLVEMVLDVPFVLWQVMLVAAIVASEWRKLTSVYKIKSV